MPSVYDLQPGTLLGRHYRVKAFLGCGWEGEVYKIEERNTGIIRAAKLFYNKRNQRNRPQQAPQIAYAKKLYKLRSCPIVIRYHHQDILTTDDNEQLSFLVSDFVDGQILSKHVAQQKSKRLIPFEALHLFYALVKGVEAIHAIKEYHGDIHSDNIIVKRKGLNYEVHLIDFLHLGRPTKQQIQQDVYDLIDVFHEIIGGQRYYSKMPGHIKKIILGRKASLISQQFKTAQDLRQHLENLLWE